MISLNPVSISEPAAPRSLKQSSQRISTLTRIGPPQPVNWSSGYDDPAKNNLVHLVHLIALGQIS